MVNKHTKVMIQSGILVGIVILLEQVGVTKPLQFIGQTMVSPLQSVGVQVARVIVFPWQMVKAGYDGARRIQELEQRYAEMAAQVGDLEAVKKENEELRAIIGSNNSGVAPRRVVGAPIISLAAPAVSAGAATPIVPGLPVLVSNTLVGVIDTVEERQSRVNLLTLSAGPRILSRTESGVEGIVIGDGQRPVLTEVPLDEPVSVGQRVVTVGQDSIPSDLFVGRVIRVEINPSATTQTIYLDQGVSFFDAKVVEIRL